jgi:hypothetical protein
LSMGGWGVPNCPWCSKPFENPPTAIDRQGNPTKIYCSPACRQGYKRAQRAKAVADLVEQLEPYVKVAGIPVYRDLVDVVSAGVQERV